MKIATFVIHPCIRSYKVSWLMMERGHSMHLVTEQILDPMGWADFNSCNVIKTGHLNPNENIFLDQLHSTFRTLAPVLDGVYYSNEPDCYLGVIRDAVGPDMPIVLDVHDMVSQRTGKIDDFEKEAWEKCDGFMAPSSVYKKIMQERYPMKPAYEVLSGVPEKLYPTQRRTPQRRGLVYEGGLKGNRKVGSDQFEFRNWADVFYKLSKMNVETFVYPSAPLTEDFSNYSRSGCIILDQLPYVELLKNLTAHEAGLVGSPFPDGAFDGAMPNKLFEYIAAGIPVIVMNAPTASDFVAATGFGVTVKEVGEIPDALELIRKEKLADYVWNMRKHWAMETQIGKVETLFNKLIHNSNMMKHCLESEVFTPPAK